MSVPNVDDDDDDDLTSWMLITTLITTFIFTYFYFWNIEILCIHLQKKLQLLGDFVSRDLVPTLGALGRHWGTSAPRAPQTTLPKVLVPQNQGSGLNSAYGSFYLAI